MKGFRHAALVVTAAYAITYGVLVFIESRWIEAYQLAGDHAKFPSQTAWMFAALHAPMIFGAIAIVGFLLTIVVHLRMFSLSTTRVTNRCSQAWPCLRQVGRQNCEG